MLKDGFSWYAAKWGSALAAIFLASGCSIPKAVDNAPQKAQPGNYTLTLLHINDHHSSLEPRRKTLTLSLDGVPTPVSVEAGGFARVSAAVKALASEAGTDVITLHAGDALTGTLYFDRAGGPGEADAALMNTVCFDAFTLGNHEFDKGDSTLKGFLDFLGAGPCKTSVLSANVRFADASALHPRRAPGRVSPSVVLERSGQRIGVIGLTIARKTRVGSSPDPGTEFEDELTSAQDEIDWLRGQGIDKVILLTHIGYAFDRRIAAQLDGVDVIVGGDSHTLLGPPGLKGLGVGSPVGDYPTRLADRNGRMVCVVQAWEHAQAVGALRVTFDQGGNVLQCDGKPQILIGDDFRVDGRPVTASQRRAVEKAARATGLLRVVAPDPVAESVLRPFMARVAEFDRTIVAQAPDELCLRRVPGGPGSVDYGRSSAACNAKGDVGRRGGDVQQLMAHAYLESARVRYGGADMALQNAGGVRVALQGRITAAGLIQAIPFGNRLVRMDISGREVKDMLEDAMDAVFGPAGSTGPYPYVAGLRFDVDATAATRQRVSGIEVRDTASGQWNPLDVAATYRLFVPSYNAGGGDGYRTLAAVPDSRRLDLGLLDVDLLLQYMERQPRDAATGLPVLRPLQADLYSTRRFKGPRP